MICSENLLACKPNCLLKAFILGPIFKSDLLIFLFFKNFVIAVLEFSILISFSLVRSDNSILNSLQILITRSASTFLFPLSIKFK